jgi:hypothetical protein
MHDDPTWAVTLDDGTALAQGEGTLFGDLPFDRVRELVVTYGPHRHTVRLGPEQRPIYFLKTQIGLNPLTGVETGRRRVVCVGWQQTVKGVNVKSLSWLNPDGTVTQGTDDPGAW